jgi:hypothetical protein
MPRMAKYITYELFFIRLERLDQFIGPSFKPN